MVQDLQVLLPPQVWDQQELQVIQVQLVILELQVVVVLLATQALLGLLVFLQQVQQVPLE